MLNFSLLAYIEVGFFEKVPYLSPQTDTRHQTDTNLNAVVALAPAGDKIKFDWAGKLGLGQANW